VLEAFGDDRGGRAIELGADEEPEPAHILNGGDAGETGAQLGPNVADAGE
jgi:hypothetical protein